MQKYLIISGPELDATVFYSTKNQLYDHRHGVIHIFTKTMQTLANDLEK